MDAKAAMVAKGQGCAVEGAVGLVGRRRMRAYDRGEGRADDGIVRTGGGIGRGRMCIAIHVVEVVRVLQL